MNIIDIHGRRFSTIHIVVTSIGCLGCSLYVQSVKYLLCAKCWPVRSPEKMTGFASHGAQVAVHFADDLYFKSSSAKKLNADGSYLGRQCPS